jgi:hypothetical protein
MLGDPWVRVVDVYVPAGHNGEGLPLLVDLVGFTGSGLSHTNWVGFRENVPERLDLLIGEERMPPLVVAFPDCFADLGAKSIHQLSFRERLGRLSAARDAAGNRAALGVRRSRAPRGVRQELPAGLAPLRTLCSL